MPPPELTFILLSISAKNRYCFEPVTPTLVKNDVIRSIFISGT